MRPLKSPELRTDHRIIEWRIRKKAENWMYRSDQVILVVGNMPDPRGTTKRYVDNPDNWQAQQKAIDGKMREWIGTREDGEVTVALCSGSRGVDLESYSSILNIRQERPNLRINVISILPVDKESFRQESVVGSIQEEYWNGLFNQLLADPHAVVHEPHFRPLKPLEYIGIGRRRKITVEKARERSTLVNGNENRSRVYSDTQQELIRLTEKAYRANPQIKKTLHMLLVTDGGKANGDGGTNEMVARFYRVFGEDIESRRKLRLLNLDLGLEEEASTFETICIIQDGMILTNGRQLVAPLEDESLGQNGEYIATVGEAYGDKFERETHDKWWDRHRTMRLRRQQRRFASPE